METDRPVVQSVRTGYAHSDEAFAAYCRRTCTVERGRHGAVKTIKFSRGDGASQKVVTLAPEEEEKIIAELKDFQMKHGVQCTFGRQQDLQKAIVLKIRGVFDADDIVTKGGATARFTALLLTRIWQRNWASLRQALHLQQQAVHPQRWLTSSAHVVCTE